MNHDPGSCKNPLCFICKDQLRTGAKKATQAELIDLKTRIGALIDQSPEKAAIILANWLNPNPARGSQRRSSVKKKAG